MDIQANTVILLLFVLLGVALFVIYRQQNISVACPPCPSAIVLGPHTSLKETPIVEARDRAVLNDTLEPPLSRDTSSNTMLLMNTPRLRDNTSYDSFSLVGYLINSSNKEDVWKLISRQVYRSRSEFYVESSNRKLDIKIPLTHEFAKAADGSGTRPFTDIYNLPEAVTIQHPMFDPHAVYKIVILPRTFN